MDEIEYKLNTNNSVLIVNAIDKLISTIKSKYKPAERQKFVLENGELKFLREKCSSKQSLVSLTACQGLLALVELGVLEIAHTMSTVVTLLPSAHNYSAIISTMAGLLILDLRSRLVPGQPYRCQFSLRSPQHPFISVMEKNKDAEDDVLTQMHALCTHPDYVVSSNSLELLRPVFLWLTSNPQRQCSLRPWQLLLSLPNSQAQNDLLLACLSCQQFNNPKLVDSAFSAYSAVADNAIYLQRNNHVMALLPLLARVANELVADGRDPRACYTAIERGFATDSPGLRACAGLTVTLLARDLPRSSALHLHSLCNLCLNIISKYEVSTLSLSTFVSLSLQWLHLPSHLTASALKTASKILEIHQNAKQDSRLYLTNLKANQTFQHLLNTDRQLFILFKIHETWERLRDDAAKMNAWLDSFESVGNLKMELLPFFFGLILENRQDWYDIVLKALKIVVGLVGGRKEVSVQLLPVLLYKIANDTSPRVKLECLKALPLMAQTKENVPTIVSILNKLKASKGVPTSFLIMLYASLAETQPRCFPYLKELLVETTNRPDDLKWEVDLARAVAVKRICEIRASSHGLELVSVISSTLNRCTDKSSALAAAAALAALAALWRGAAVAPPSAWQALKHKLRPDTRPQVQIALCELLSEIPGLRASTPEYDALISEAARELWRLVAESHQPTVVGAACLALSQYKLEDYKLKDIPEVYRRTVKLPASYCKTPADAARNPEDVLDYIPCEIWPEVFKFTNQAALPSVVQLASKLIEREVRAYRSGVYQVANRSEPTTAEYLPPHSVVRGLLDCFRKQATNPSYDFPEPVLLAILSVLSSEYPRPLPPLELSWLHGASARGRAWRAGALRLAARSVGASGRRVVEVYLKEVEEGQIEESEVLELFELLPILCRNTPPNTLRAPLERCLHAAYQDSLQKKKHNDKDTLFARQMDGIKSCLECDKIHDANRTLLSQFVENYYNVIEDDNVAWPSFANACCALSTKYLERMTSPSSWWEVSASALRRAANIRGLLAARGECSLVWLNEIIDAQAGQITEQEYSLQCMSPALQATRPDEESRDWLLQLMARTQVAFKQSEDPSSKLYLCDVFALSVASFSGYACVSETGSRASRTELLPASVAALCERPAWKEHVKQILEWLCHTRDSSPDPGLAQASQRALLALRHTTEFDRIWTRLESHFGRHVSNDD
ncbi:focadhesin [Leguminivora glycinivorella]|uniref:focadhesin n=1 Tax=Leguminivora glycinivorella TaxID=1035111 RepID=UPI00200DFE20|nr:focadhesin [Leguminivora glycinivorella]